MGKKKIRIVKIIIAFLLVVVLALLAVGGYLFVQNTTLTTIAVEGNEHYSDAEFLKLIFPKEEDRQTFRVWWNERQGEHEDIPFISRYEVTLTGLHSAEIMVYEKSIVACLEYMGSIMYFDKDGIVVESTEKNTEDVPIITGINFSQIVMYQPIVVENEKVFTAVLGLTQLLSLNELKSEKIYYNKNLDARLYMGDIKVELGGTKYMEEKILELRAMLPKLDGKAGTLYLDSYDPDVKNPQYRFKPE